MSSRPNLHARHNRDTRACAARAGDEERSGRAAEDASPDGWDASYWLDEIGTLPGEELLSAIRSNFPYFSYHEHGACFSRWWSSPDPKLRLVAAIGYTRGAHGPGEPTYPEIRGVLVDLFRDGGDARLQRIAAFALADLSLEHVLGANQPEIIVLYEALANPELRRIALDVLLSLVADEWQGAHRSPVVQVWWYFSPPWRATLLQLLNDPQVPPRDLFAALRLALNTHEASGKSCRAQVRRLLRAPEIDEESFDFVGDLVMRGDVGSIADVLFDPGITVERRLRLVSRIRRLFPRAPLDQADWDVLFQNIADSPQLSAAVIELLVERCLLSRENLANLAQDATLPIEVRQEVYRIFWSQANWLADGATEPSILEYLLSMPDAPTLAREAFGKSLPSPFCGPISTKAMHRLLAILRDPACGQDTFYRGLLAHAIPCDRILIDDERRVIAHALRDVAPLLEDLSRVWVIRNLLRHAIYSPAVARDILWDERLPMDDRLKVLGAQISRPEVFRFARGRKLADPDVITIATHLGTYVDSPGVKDRLRNAASAYETVKEWRVLLEVPEFCEDDTFALIGVVSDVGRSSLTRQIAQEFLRTALREAPERCPGLFRALCAAASSQNLLRAEIADTVRQLLKAILSYRSNGRQILPDLVEALANPAISEEFRVAILQMMQGHLFRLVGAEIWDVVAASRSRPLRAALIDALKEWHRLPDHAFFTQLPERLRKATTPEEVASAEKSWDELAPLAALWRANLAQLVSALIDYPPTTFMHACAIHILAKRAPADGEVRGLWERLKSPEVTPLWDNPKARGAIIGHLQQTFADDDLDEFFLAGPRHPVWLAVASLATLPDQSLAAEALSTFPLPLKPEVYEDLLFTKRPSLFPHVPDAAVLALRRLLIRSDSPEDVARTLDTAFQRAQAHHTDADALVHGVVRAACRRPRIRERLTTLLGNPGLREDSPENKVRAIIDLLRFADLEAHLIARETSRNALDFASAPDLSEAAQAQLVPIDAHCSAEQASACLRERILGNSLRHLPGVAPDQLARVLDDTPAPVFLAEHYLRTHRTGLPLLASAITAASGGSESWENWRFDRPEARAQLPHLDESQQALWRKNFQVAVDRAEVSGEVLQAAARIRERFQHARQQGEIAPELTTLLGAAGEAPGRIRGYQAIIREVIGPAIGGRMVPVESTLSEPLPNEFADRLRRATEDADRQSLLTLRYQLERAIDLLRLLNCDPRALARNELRARGEDGENRGEGAVAQIKRMQVAFRKPPTRRLRHEEYADDHRLDAALAQSWDILDELRTFDSSKSLVVAECSDFPTLIEIGNRPYGQGSCQNYVNANTYNQALLAYVVDAMTKALVLHTSPTTGNPGERPSRARLFGWEPARRRGSR